MPAFADEGETTVVLEIGGGGGIAGSPRTPLTSFGPGPLAIVGVSLRQGVTNNVAISVGATGAALFAVTNAGGRVTSDSRRPINGDLRSDIFIASLPLRAEWAFDLGAEILGFAVADAYVAGALSPAVGLYQNNFLLVPGRPNDALLSPGQIEPDFVFGGQASIAVGGRIRVFDLVGLDLEARATGGFVGAPQVYGALLFRPHISAYPFNIL